jgi:hypothetical protein
LLGGRVAFEQAAGAVFQPLAAQPGRAGQVVPVQVQAGEGQALVERVFDLDLIAAFVAMPADMQRLVDVADQMQQPGQGIGDLFGLAAGFSCRIRCSIRLSSSPSRTWPSASRST